MGRRPRVAAAKPAGDGAGAARGPAEGHIPARRLTERRSLRLPCCAECAFPLRRRPGGVGRNPPASLRGTMESGPTGQTCSSNPPPGWRGGCARVRRPRPAGPASRKSAVWAEGLAESAPRARPGHHQAASCGLRGCRELSITSLALSALPAPRAPCPVRSGRWALTPGSPPSPRLSSEAPCPAPPTPLAPPSGADMVKTLIEASFRWPYEVNTG